MRTLELPRSANYAGSTNPRSPMSPRARRNPDKRRYSGRIAARIRELRDAKGMSVDELWLAVKSAGGKVSTTTLVAYENGTRKVNPDLYPAIAKALGCRTVREFLPEK